MRARYLASADLRRIPALSTDVLVVGGGVAGLSAAIAAASEGASVTVLMKAGDLDSNTAHAQGGIAVALADDDDPQSHLDDTVRAGAGLVDEAAARKLVTQGPACVRQLIDWGAEFDRTEDGARIAFTREAAHDRARIVHARGDATGAEVARTLLLKARGDPKVTLVTEQFVVDLLHADGRVQGALSVPALGSNASRVACGGLAGHHAAATVLASGGAGRLYRETTNPDVATADGCACAYRAGARLADMEFVQFHPTALYVAGAPRLLISEAVRGEGAYLVNTLRERFMPGYHAEAELAPRDVVSASMIREMAKTDSPHVYLDMRHLPAERVLARFPGIAETCAGYGLNFARDLVPVRPAAHYMMGGILTDAEARTSVERLFACGEVACTGLHGANRLASNSLLEGLVFGRAAGLAAADTPGAGIRPLTRIEGPPDRAETDLDLDLDLSDVEYSLRSLMTRSVGVFRDGRELSSASRALGHWLEYVLPAASGGPRAYELKNMLVTATLVVRSALEREESRGAHKRLDFPERDDRRWQHRIVRHIGEFD